MQDNPTQLNTKKSNTEKQSTDKQNTDSIPSFRGSSEAKRSESANAYQEYRDLICENIEYENLKQQHPCDADSIDEILELMLEVVCSKRKVTRVAGTDFPHEIVRSRFLKLNSEHIQFVLKCLRENTTKVRNIKQYLLTVLFNASATISNYYTALVNHDLANDS